jgi:putative transcriptional regulator
VDNVNLTGHFLIAMPAMKDPHFARSLAYICEHNDKGALGIIINRPLEMKLNDLFGQINVEAGLQPFPDDHVYFGGPVQTDRGFVLHQPVGAWQSTIAVSGDTALTTSKDILEATARGQGPERMLVSLGYAGWAAGQLEQELAQNAWLTVEASDAVLFDLPADQRVGAAMNLLGINFANFAEQAGHA